MNNEQLIQQALEVLKDKSMIIAMEELAELQQAISKMLRGKQSSYLNLCEEIADVYIVLEWVKTYFKVSSEDVEIWNAVKKDRIKKRLENGELQ